MTDFAPVAAPPSITVPSGVDLTLVGAGDGAEITKATGANGYHLTLTGDGTGSVTLDKLSFLGHNDIEQVNQPGVVSGGGVQLQALENVTVSKVTFAGIDGATALSTGRVTNLDVSRSSFLGNRASSGAALSLQPGITATISDTTIYKNYGVWPGYAGGAIRGSGNVNATFIRTVFDQNLSTTRGGAIAMHQFTGNLTVRNSVFNQNTVPLAASNTSINDGGAIAVTEVPGATTSTARTLIDGTTFTGNIAADEGGAILAHSGPGSDVTVQNSTFFENRAEGRQQTFDDNSGGGAIEAFGTPLTLLQNTFVNNYAELGTSFLTQRGGAVSATGNTAALPTQPVVMSHNLLVGNDVLNRAGASAPSSAFRQVSARAGIETIPGETPPVPASGDGIPGFDVPNAEDLELIYPDRDQNPAEEGDDFLPVVAVPGRALTTNVGIDNGVALDLATFNPLTVLGTATPTPSDNRSTITVGDPNGAFAAVPGTIPFLPFDPPFLNGVADNVAAAAPSILTDQRGFPVDEPADAGAVQERFVRYDPNGGDWANYTDSPFDGSRIVLRDEDDVVRVWAITPVEQPTTTEPEPTTPPAGTRFVGWNDQPDGSGAAYAAGSVTAPAGNLRLYAQWELDRPLVEGAVTVDYLDQDGKPLRAPISLTGTVGDPYSAEQLAFDGFRFVSVNGAVTGSFTEEAQSIQFHYAKTTTPTDPTTPTTPASPPLASTGFDGVVWLSLAGVLIALGAAATFLRSRRRKS